MAETLRFRPEDLKAYAASFFCHFGVPKEDAEIVADVLITADLRGVHSHGIARLHAYYGNRLRRGLINPQTPLTLLHETPTTLAFDAGNGLGQVAGVKAMQACIAKAREVGVGIATVRNSNHYGIAGYYAMLALEHNMIGVSLTNSQPLVAPTYGRTRVLGTNPIALAVPTGKERPFVLDMATSIVPMGKIALYAELGQQIPLGWGIDKAGNLTQDPKAIRDGGCLLPLGGTDVMRGYKGYGLALVVDILSGVLSGAAFGPYVGSPSSSDPSPVNIGHFFLALRVDAFRPLEDFKQDMDHLISTLHQAPKAPGQPRIYIHGEKEFEEQERNLREGIPVPIPVVEELKKKGAEVGIPFELAPVGEGR